ncbi:LTA synthase family protein [Bhargavaea ginsengi]|uniref:LTA synthase family protein n=1 Tax=Bhargavaea ginsengi TaxID=426757 RepID=UPI00203F7963|nr:LTA synthase family protein [Bhargavaea ginsengi]MCM3088100.1 LTA synthase family protein [Bhargavaea ginsengi]
MSYAKRIAKVVLFYTSVVIYSVFFSFVLEWIVRGGRQQAMDWAEARTSAFGLVTVFLISLFLMLTVFKRKLFIIITLLVSAVLLILAVVNRIKMTLRGDPLIPADLALVSEAKSMVTFLGDRPGWQLAVAVIVAILIIVGLAYGIYRMPKGPKWSPFRLIVAGAAAFLFFWIYNEEVEQKESKIRERLGLEIIPYNQQWNYDHNGFVMAFTRNIKWMQVEPPSNYKKQEVERIIEKYKEEPYQVTDRKPHIIMIMSEAFWDPTQLDNVEFNEDPLPNFHAMQEEHTSGTLLVPVFGGSTANTEFESITGYSMNFLPAGSVPYFFNVKKPVQALPHILREQGYSTTAIHSYHSWFYGRKDVYRNLGFQNFVSLEYIPKPVVDFMYYRDREAFDLIINQIQEADQPNFILNVTMQNHGPYVDDMKKPYATIEADMKDGSFSPAAKNILEFFSDNMVQIDLELIRLIENLDAAGEDVLVMYYGDHKPLLGNNYQVYKEAGYFEDEVDFESYQKIYTTPFLVWDNFSDQREDLDLSTSFLPAYVLRRAGLEGTHMTNMQNHLIDEGYGFLPREDYLGEAGYPKEKLEEYEIFQYDYLMGRKYDPDAKASADPDYRLGYADPEVTDVTHHGVDLRVEGENFTSSTKIFIDGEMLPTEFVDEQLLLSVSEEDLKGKDIVLKVLDSNKLALFESEPMKIE